MNRRRLVAALLLLSLALPACTLPLPRLVFDTPTPGAGPGPTPTPLPTAIVNFNVRVPPTTPPGSAPAVRVFDPVSGRTTTVILTDAGNNLWTGGTQAPVGSVLRYKYVRPLPVPVEEVTANREPVSLRLFHVTGEPATVDDIVAGWSDVTPAGDLGSLTGRVWNANTGQGVLGIVVAAGGQLAVTGHDGGFAFYGLPVGQQRVTALAPDGSLRPTQQVVGVGAGQTADVDLVSTDPNAVHVTFLVRPAPGQDSNAVLRLAGNVWQLGDSLVPAEGGASIAAARLPTLVPLADGRWTATVELYEGTLLSYKYTLGDGYWNGELDSAGNPRLRHLVVPATDTLIDEAIVQWRSSGSPAITFEALTPSETPATDSLAVQFRTDRWLPPVPMWRVGANDWRFVLYNPTDFDGSVFYRYCRNFACGTADDTATAGEGATGRFFTPALFAQNLRDNVTGWQWLDPAPGVAGTLPAITAHPGFAAGVDFDDQWRPNALPYYAQTFNSVRTAGAGWVTFTRRAAALQMQPTPAYGEVPGLAPLPLDWHQLANAAHTVGLRVALHPVTCHYTPYGACEYWNGVNYGGNFWNEWFGAYEQFLLTQAELARLTATDMLVVGDFKLRPALPGEPEAPPDAEARWRGLISRVREVYKGQLAFELLMGETLWPNTPPFLDAVDVVRVWWWSPLASSNTPSTADMAAAAASLMDTHLLPVQQRFNRPIHISAAYLSVDGAATQCLRRPDGQCHHFEDFGPGNPGSASGYVLDLQEQADIYAALLEAVNPRLWVGGFSAYGYNPAVVLRDRSLSVRGKPAEAVLFAWYPGLSGR